MISPFKFLNAYVRNDAKFFFGRDEEIDELYELIFQTDFLLVYGQSGTGKTSLIQCGLASRFPDGDRLEVLVRRRGDLNTSLRNAINKEAETPIDSSKSLPAAIHSLYRDHFCPVHLIFDQFEELFLLGEEAERREFIEQITALVHSKAECKIIIVMREEFIAHMYELYDFGEKLPAKLRKRFRVEPMSAQKVRSVILKTTEHHGIELEHGKTTVNKIQTNLGGAGTQEHLSYLQVYLDTLFQRATKGRSGDSPAPVRFTDALVDKTGKLSDVLADFLRTQTKATQQVVLKHHPKAPPHTVQTVLEAFTTVDGTKRPLSTDDLKKEVGEVQKFVDEALFAALVSRRILRPLGDGEATGRDQQHGQPAATMYELSHDSLARCINASSGELRKKKLRAERIVKRGYSSHQETSDLLSRKELALVERHREQLRLSREETAFVNASVAHRERKTRTAYLLAIAVVAAIGYSALSAKDSKQKSHVFKTETKAAKEETKVANSAAHALRVTMVATSDEATPEVATALLREVDEEDSDAGMALLEARLPAALQALRRASAVSVSSLEGETQQPDGPGGPSVSHAVDAAGLRALKPRTLASPDGAWAVTLSVGGRARVWRVNGGNRSAKPLDVRTNPASEDKIYIDNKPGYDKAAWSRDGKWLLLTGSKRWPAAVWSHTSGGWKKLSKHGKRLSRHGKKPRSTPDRSAVFVGKDDEFALVTSQSGELRLWDLNRESSARLGAEKAYFKKNPAVSKEKCQVVGITDQGAGRYFHICDAPGTWSASFSPSPVELRGGYMVGAEFAAVVEAGESARSGESPDGTEQLITRSEDGDERTWDLARLKTRAWSLDRAIMLDQPKVRYDSSEDGSTILALQGGEARVWAAKDKSLLCRLRGVKKAELSPDGTKILVIYRSRDTALQLCPTPKTSSEGMTCREGCQTMGSDPRFARSLTKAGFSPQGVRAYSLSWEGIAQVWKLAQGTNGPVEKPVVLGASRRTGRKVAEVFFTADSTKVVTRTRGSRDLYVRELAATSASIRLKFHKGRRPRSGAGTPGPIYKLRVLGSKAIGLMKDGDVLVWDLRDLKDLKERGHKELEPRVLKGHKAQATAVALSTDGNYLATAGKLRSKANGLLIWDLSDRDAEPKPRELTGLLAEATAAAFDGTRLVMGSSDRSVRVWDVKSSKKDPLRVLRGNRTAVTSVALGPKNQVASGSADGALRVWKGESKRESKSRRTALVVRPPATTESKGGERGLTEVKFDGENVRSRSASGIASTWVIDPAEVLAKLWEQTPYCIQVNARIEMLDEDEADSKTRFKKCNDEVVQRQANATTVDSGRPPATVELQGHSAGVTVDRSAARASVADAR